MSIDSSREVPSLMNTLKKWKVVREEKNGESKQCGHCGCEGELKSFHGIMLCPRCRQDYCFCYKIGKKEVGYKWCFRCHDFHNLPFFWNSKFGVFDLCCEEMKRDICTPIKRVDVSMKSEEEMVKDASTFYSKFRDRLTRIVLLETRKQSCASLNGVCCVCLKRNVRKSDSVKRVRYLGLTFSRYSNQQNPPCKLDEKD